jgi:glucose-1-phosphate adenylyltransferase
VLIDELLRAVAGAAEASTAQIHEVLRRMIPRRRAYGWVYHGPWHYTRTLDEYVQFHRDLLGPNPAVDLGAWIVKSNTMTRRSAPPPPARFLPGAEVENSLVCDGCVIAGVVRNSVLSPGVRVAAGATVLDSVLWDDVIVDPGAQLDRVVSDKRCRFGENARVGEGDPAPSQEMPASLTCGATIVGMDSQVPAGARIGRNCLVHPEADLDALRQPIPSGRSVHRAHSGGGRA